MTSTDQLARLAEVMATLRQSCPWDARQTHRSLVQYLVEETLEVVESIESEDRDDLREELGDLLLQVFFHAQIASEDQAGFDLQDVARGVSDKLVRRHPHVFAPVEPTPDRFQPTAEDVLAELNVTWERRKALEKGRTSVLEGIPDQLSAMAKASKIIGRSRSRNVQLGLPDTPVDAGELGAQVLDLVARAQSSGLDAEQAVRDAVRQLESRVREAESQKAQSQKAQSGPAQSPPLPSEG